MRALIYLLTFSAVIASGFWAYRENYATQQALKDVSKLNSEIADLREALSIQRAEWAYLNRPERLRELVQLNADKLNLKPITSSQFVDTSKIDYPPPPVKYPPRRPDNFVPPTEGAITDADPTPSEQESSQ